MKITNLEKKIKDQFNLFSKDESIFPTKIDRNDPELIEVLNFFGDISGRKILDAGCAKGRFAKILAEKGAKVYGLDFSRKMIREARKTIKSVEFKVGSLTKIPFEDNFFDFILCVEVLEHIPDTEKAISEMGRVLKPNGKIIIIDKNIFSLEEKSLSPAFIFKRIQEIRNKWMYPNNFPFREKWFISRYLNNLLGKYFRQIESRYMVNSPFGRSERIYRIFPFLSYKIAWKAFGKKKTFLDLAIDWLELAQYKEGKIRGFVPKFIYQNGSSVPYPEITGYAASIFARLYHLTSQKRYLKKAYNASKAIIRIMCSNGAIPSVVTRNGIFEDLIYAFDQGVMARGLFDTYEASLSSLDEKKEFLKAGIKAVNYLIEIQNSDGSFYEKFKANKDRINHYFSSISAKIIMPYLRAYKLTGQSLYLQKAQLLGDCIVKNQSQIGNFQNFRARENRTHYHCYAIEGLVELYKKTKKRKYYQAAKKATDFLLTIQKKNGGFNLSVLLLSSGEDIEDVATAAQAINLFLFSYSKTSREIYLIGAQKALEYLETRQYRLAGSRLNGGLPFLWPEEKKVSCSWSTIFAINAFLNYRKLESELF